ncbi:hypothetical protein G9C98_006265 [Cotesia typhae]|uniref:Calponin-homology (CH) domain-containing protein n=1 Tax=Cotesia typhae TaxID=2053667 RepID=A0A8J5V9E6_9HYME|nr:hypothetical protein G9C98_006265 [Cotesia typhae]
MALERQVRAKVLAKRDPQQEKEAQEWIEAILGKKFPAGEAYEDVLRDGQVLCELMNKLVPGAIPKINSSGGQFKLMENINNFQKAMKEYGVHDVDVFQTSDLFEKKDIAQVTTSLFALGRTDLILDPNPQKNANATFLKKLYALDRQSLDYKLDQTKALAKLDKTWVLDVKLLSESNDNIIYV